MSNCVLASAEIFSRSNSTPASVLHIIRIVTNNSTITKYELLDLFNKHTKKNINIKKFESKFVDKSFVDTRLLLNHTIPSYDEMIFEMIETIVKNRPLYSQFKAIYFDKE